MFQTNDLCGPDIQLGLGGIIRSAEAGNRQGGREEGGVARLLGRWPPRFTSTIRNNDFSHKDMIDNFGEYSFD